MADAEPPGNSEHGEKLDAGTSTGRIKRFYCQKCMKYDGFSHICDTDKDEEEIDPESLMRAFDPTFEGYWNISYRDHRWKAWRNRRVVQKLQHATKFLYFMELLRKAGAKWKTTTTEATTSTNMEEVSRPTSTKTATTNIPIRKEEPKILKYWHDFFCFWFGDDVTQWPVRYRSFTNVAVLAKRDDVVTTGTSTDDVFATTTIAERLRARQQLEVLLYDYLQSTSEETIPSALIREHENTYQRTATRPNLALDKVEDDHVTQLILERNLCDIFNMCHPLCPHRRLQTSKGTTTAVTTAAATGSGITIDYLKQLRDEIFGPSDDDPVAYFPKSFIETYGGIITEAASSSSSSEDIEFPMLCKDAATNTGIIGAITPTSSADDVIEPIVKIIYSVLESPKNAATNTDITEEFTATTSTDEPSSVFRIGKWHKDADTNTAITPEPVLVSTSTSTGPPTVATEMDFLLQGLLEIVKSVFPDTSEECIQTIAEDAATSTAQIPEVQETLPKVGSDISIEVRTAKALSEWQDLIRSRGAELHSEEPVHKEPSIWNRIHQQLIYFPSDVTKDARVLEETEDSAVLRYFGIKGKFVSKEPDPAIGRWKRMAFHGNQLGIFDSLPGKQDELLCEEEACSRKKYSAPQVETFTNKERKTLREAVLEAKKTESLKCAQHSLLPPDRVLEEEQKREEQEQKERNKEMIDVLLKPLEEEPIWVGSQMGYRIYPHGVYQKSRDKLREEMRMRERFDEAFITADRFQRLRLKCKETKIPLEEEMKKYETETPLTPPIEPSYTKEKRGKSDRWWTMKEELDLIFAVIDLHDLNHIYYETLKERFTICDIIKRMDILMRDCPVRPVMQNLPSKIVNKFRRRILADPHLRDMIARVRNEDSSNSSPSSE
ncbi:uncharacterized protein LOC118184820 [Stegodyphus dumicola]|uniref:uncharacterized protein LOC118184820 n=1 Tax=Stegodyphus dumicola TaxID=202533 RepID=UPI0015B1B6D4|nr:uncharacterized protein LOC118184820 [Stegodyphus dumicola]